MKVNLSTEWGFTRSPLPLGQANLVQISESPLNLGCFIKLKIQIQDHVNDHLPTVLMGYNGGKGQAHEASQGHKVGCQGARRNLPDK